MLSLNVGLLFSHPYKESEAGDACDPSISNCTDLHDHEEHDEDGVAVGTFCIITLIDLRIA